MDRILVASVNWLGDAILMTPIFRAIKEKFPSSYLGVMTVERVRGVFEGNPYIDEIIIFDEKGVHKGIWNKIKFAAYLRGKRFDTVFLIHRSFTRAFTCFLSGIKNRIGYRRPKNFFILTEKIIAPADLVCRQDYYLYLFEKIGGKIKNRFPEVFLPAQRVEAMNERLAPLRINHPCIIGVNPSANWELKRWPEDYFASLCDRLIKKFNCAVIFIGADKEKALVQRVVDKMAESPYDFCGKTDLADLGALIKNMDLFISNDSGPAHLAAALSVNTLVIFGPTSDKITSPVGNRVSVLKKDVGCQIPCYNLACEDNVCMKNISTDEVYAKASKILEG